MATRREAREWAVQILFQWDFNPGEMDRVLKDFWSERKGSARERQFAESLARGAIEKRESVDEAIRKYADNWDIRRMGAVDRNVMRIAVYEMLYRPDIPPVVSINEAVDIARDFSDDASAKFVNGILDRLRKDLDRPARTAVREGQP